MNRQFKQVLLVILDVLFVNVAIFAGYFIRFSWNIPAAYITIYKKSFIPIAIIMIVSFYIFKLYKSIWRYASIDELVSVILAVSLFRYKSALSNSSICLNATAV